MRWDPNRENEAFFHQSAWLYCAYYYIQIIVHRPFIPSVGKSSPLSFPSLAICTNAARSCSHIVDLHMRRSKTPSQFQVRLIFFFSVPENLISCWKLDSQIAVFTSGIVLLLNIWSGKRNGLSTDPTKEMAEVHKCMQILKMNENRCVVFKYFHPSYSFKPLFRSHASGRLWYICVVSK